jgi:hypothetical protein
MVSKVVRRQANRALTLGAGRGGTTPVTPQSGGWEQFPSTILATSFAELQRAAAALPERHLAEFLVRRLADDAGERVRRPPATASGVLAADLSPTTPPM